MLTGIVYAIGGFIEALVGLRFIFELFGADPASPFVTWIYSLSTPFVAPFAGIFGQNATITGAGVVTTSTFDWAALVALVIIGIVFGILARVLTPRRVV
ncbi:MAG: hypothetical protein JWN33_275 [Candidatus Saccharibacteria bacterium]|nr:hypothetical protein [Candidatus Saccharibacteria bacterium]